MLEPDPWLNVVTCQEGMAHAQAIRDLKGLAFLGAMLGRPSTIGDSELAEQTLRSPWRWRPGSGS